MKFEFLQFNDSIANVNNILFTSLYMFRPERTMIRLDTNTKIYRVFQEE